LENFPGVVGCRSSGAAVGDAISLLGFAAFLLLATLLPRLVARNSGTSRWLGTTLVASGAVYVGITLGIGFAGSGAARLAAQHGLPASTVAALSDLHWLGVYLATAVLGLFTVALATALWTSGALPRWIAVPGFVAGACCFAAAAQPPSGVADDVTLIWMIWFGLFGIMAMRGPRARRGIDAVPADAVTAVG
jgi:hypothetical protein